MTNELCQTACQAAGFSMAGTEYGGECCKNPFVILIHVTDGFQGAITPSGMEALLQLVQTLFAMRPAKAILPRPVVVLMVSMCTKAHLQLPPQELANVGLPTITTTLPQMPSMQTSSKDTAWYLGLTTGGSLTTV
jgi:hypothetical protein